MTIGPPPICLMCSRLYPRKGAPCAAFPGGIPAEIWVGAFDHRKKFRGDGGIRFELIPGKEAELR